MLIRVFLNNIFLSEQVKMLLSVFYCAIISAWLDHTDIKSYLHACSSPLPRTKRPTKQTLSKTTGKTTLKPFSDIVTRKVLLDESDFWNLWKSLQVERFLSVVLYPVCSHCYMMVITPPPLPTKELVTSREQIYCIWPLEHYVIESLVNTVRSICIETLWRKSIGHGGAE